ncbi:MAG TPA: MipA/OmpV family protein [Burkholderiales bacterium]|nr:MipA/OmpV family protein [Burkholderiales bacterium]
MRTLLLAGLLVLCCAGPARAQTAEPSSGWHGTVGAGPVFIPKYAGGSRLEALPLPIAYVDYDDWFYVNLFRAGAYAWSTADKKTGVAFAVEPRLGFTSGDGAKLAGMQTRRDSLQGGPTFDTEGGWGSLSVGYFTDLTGASHGGYLDALYNKTLVKDERWTLNGSLQATRLDSKITNYYFGVRAGEVTPTRAFYQPGATTNITLWLTGQYNLSARNALMFGANVTRLGGAATGSPIVERRDAPLLYIGLGWNL